MACLSPLPNPPFVAQKILLLIAAVIYLTVMEGKEAKELENKHPSINDYTIEVTDLRSFVRQDKYRIYYNGPNDQDGNPTKCVDKDDKPTCTGMLKDKTGKRMDNCKHKDECGACGGTKAYDSERSEAELTRISSLRVRSEASNTSCEVCGGTGNKKPNKCWKHYNLPYV